VPPEKLLEDILAKERRIAEVVEDIRATLVRQVS
jgi:hypothetical protein